MIIKSNFNNAFYARYLILSINIYKYILKTILKLYMIVNNHNEVLGYTSALWSLIFLIVLWEKTVC